MMQINVSQGALTERDVAFLNNHGIPLPEARRQLALLLNDTPRWTHVDRACTVGDGVMCFEGAERAHLVNRGWSAVRQGRLTDFIPASGAASRMFADLMEVRQKGDQFLQSSDASDSSESPLAKKVRTIFNHLKDFAFYRELREAVLRLSDQKIDLDTISADRLISEGHARSVIQAMVDSEGLGLKDRPKALIPFHFYGGNDVRTPIYEHLSTSADLCAGITDVCKLHFTCSPEHRADFEREVASAAQKVGTERGLRFDVTFSAQEPCTDTICVTSDGEIARSNGNPIVRPGGHGALLYNLARLAQEGADIAYINNIDNVHPESTRAEFLETKLLLLGVLCEAQEIAHLALQSLQQGCMLPEGVEELYRTVKAQLGISIPEEQWHASTPANRSALLIAALDRPVRVVGVVKNTGEPGGGPLWVRGADSRVTLQVVEKHELNPGDQDQLRLFNEGTHFNPVRIMAGLKNHAGEPHDLTKYVKEDAVLMGSKIVGGVPVKILELPGLWNGSMHGWITVFVEVGVDTFAPVKSVIDLARPAHQC